MTWLSVCLFLIVFAFARTESTSANGFARNLFAVAPEVLLDEAKKDGDMCDADSLNNLVCENDRLQFCGPNNVIMSTPCTLNGRPAYCNCEKNGCVREKPICPNQQDECFFPNTKMPYYQDCKKFTYCNAQNKKLTLQCPSTFVYDPKSEKCVDQSMARCARISCPFTTNMVQLVPFPQASNYYVLCYNGVGDVRKCPDKFYGVQNNTCQFDCTLKGASGLFKDSNLAGCKAGNYYACRKAGIKYLTTAAKCPAGLTFDETFGICTSEDTCTETKTVP